MKNRYLTKCLCITMAMTMAMGNGAVVFASEGTALSGIEGESTAVPLVSEIPEDLSGVQEAAPEESQEALPDLPATPVPDENVTDSAGNLTGTPAPSETPMPEVPGEPSEGSAETPSVTPTPEVPGEPSEGPTETPTPSETPTPEVPGEPSEGPTETPSPSVTPTPEETPGAPSESPTETPTPSTAPVPELSEKSKKKVKKLIRDIKSVFKLKYNKKKTKKVSALRKRYDKLSEQEKAAVSNYKLLLEMEEMILLMGDAAEDVENEAEALNPAVTAAPVYASNLHAGKEFYLNSLQENYQLSFSEDFAQVMEQIETEYKEQNQLQDVSDRNGGVTTSADALLVRNWQDILAIYIYERSQNGETSYYLDGSCKAELAAIFAEMNPVIRESSGSGRVGYGNWSINDYIKKHKIPKEQRALLKKYLETDCKLLCATVTAAKGFVRQSVGESVSEERVNVITAAYSLVGKIGYFWGGKSTAIGMDPSWGSIAQVTAEGSQSTGTYRAYGLDCSGFVTWAVINGYEDQAMIAAVGSGTSDQWGRANVISEAEAQPGDLVFQRGPEAGMTNHVGIICGKTDAGDWIVVHCSSGKNGVTVGEAYSASFRYIRQPSFYPNAQQVEEMRKSGKVIENAYIAGIDVSNGLQALIQANLVTTGDMDTITEDPSGNGMVSPGSLYVVNSLQELLAAGENISVFSQVTYGVAALADVPEAAGEQFVEADGFAKLMVSNSLQELLSVSIGIQ